MAETEEVKRRGSLALGRHVLMIAAFLAPLLYSQDDHAQKESPKGIQTVLQKHSLAELEKAFRARATKSLYDDTPEDLKSIPSRALSDEIIYRQKTIYGFDRRKDLYEITDSKQLAVAGAVGGLISTESFTESPSGIKIVGKTLRKTETLCGGVRFEDQPVAPYCTAFIVGSDLIATAGHCTGGWRDARFVLNFRALDQGSVQLDIPKSDVYRLTSLLQRAEEPDGVDFAVFRVDREIKSHEPLKLDLHGSVAQDDEVYVIGHPSGLPLKLADHAFVSQNPQRGYFIANLDTFGGNSGSPVFNSNTHEVEGILVRGGTDYEREGTCMVAFVCPNGTAGCRGEDSTLISAIADTLNGAQRQKVLLSPITKTFSSGPKVSGARKDFSGQYELASDPAPPGYRIGRYSYSLSGDRSCGNWATCAASLDNDHVVLRFSLQGHDEWLPPGQALSEAHLVVTYEPQ